MMLRVLLPIPVVFALVSPVGAQTPVAVTNDGTEPAKSRSYSDDEMRARMLGVLMYTHVSVQFDAEPARSAISLLDEALDVSIVGRYLDDKLGFGIDPETPITLEATDQPAVDVLEAVLEQCELDEACTWQLRKGFVEVSTKARLSVPAARERRVYDIGDLLLEPPRFSSQGSEGDGGDLGPYGSAILSKPAPSVSGGSGTCGGGYCGGGISLGASVNEGVARKRPEQLAGELVAAIVETIEPGHWDTGDDGDDDGPMKDQRHNLSGGSVTGSGGGGGSGGSGTAGVSDLYSDTWASIRYLQRQLIVTAPDFVHRQIDGYPKPIRPEAPPAPSEASPARGTAAARPR